MSTHFPCFSLSLGQWIILQDVCFCSHTLALNHTPNTHTFVFSAFSPSAQCSAPKPVRTDPPLPRPLHPFPHPATVVRSHLLLLPAALLGPSPLSSTLPDPRPLPLIPVVPAPHFIGPSPFFKSPALSTSFSCLPLGPPSGVPPLDLLVPSSSSALSPRPTPPPLRPPSPSSPSGSPPSSPPSVAGQQGELSRGGAARGLAAMGPEAAQTKARAARGSRRARAGGSSEDDNAG